MQSILVADIGGTHCRLGLFDVGEGLLRLERCVWIPTETVQDTGSLLRAMERELDFSPACAAALGIALAGPVDALHGKLTNAALRIDMTDAPLRHGIKHFCLINDFVAQAWACLTPAGKSARLVLGPSDRGGEENSTCIGVLGAGTGLGMAVLRRAGGQWIAGPSEGGHAAFPFVGHDENGFHEFLREKLQRPFARCEDVLSGRGLALLHWHLSGERLNPREVSSRALRMESVTLRWFSRFYARACRNWILSSLCRDGLWITGGIACGNPLCVTGPAFREELHSGQEDGMVPLVPIRLMDDENSGLWGAAQACDLLLREK